MKLIMIKFKRMIINFTDLVDFAPGKPLTLEFVHEDGSKDIILANHT
jgi:aconitate hydratase